VFSLPIDRARPLISLDEHPRGWVIYVSRATAIEQVFPVLVDAQDGEEGKYEDQENAYVEEVRQGSDQDIHVFLNS
jgi:hypothetical protein